MRIAWVELPVTRPSEAATFADLAPGLRYVAGSAAVHHVALHAAELAAARAQVEARTALLADGREFDFGDWAGARAFYFRDGAGNVLEAIARSNPQPAWEIAEVGLPVPDVRAAVAELCELGFPGYDDDGDDSFAAIGDDRGLLIAVREGRGWLPTDEPSLSVPLRIAIEDLAEEHRIGPHVLVPA